MGYRNFVGVGLNPRQIPAVPVRIDGANGIAGGNLAGYWLLNGGVPVDLVGRYGQAVAGPSGTPVLASTSVGPGHSWSGASNIGWTVNSGPIIGAQLAWTIAATIQTSAAANGAGRAIYAERPTSGNDIIQFAETGSGASNFTVIARNDAGTITFAADTTAINDGSIRTLVATYDGTNIRLYQNGVLTNTSGWAGGGTFTDAGVISSIGYDNANSSAYWSGSVLQVAVFKSTLAAGAIAQLSAEPFGMLRPLVRRTYFVTAAIAAGALSGTAAATSAATGTLTGAGALAGTSAAASTATATLTGSGALSGTSAAASTATGTLRGSGALAGSSAATATATGTLAGAGALAGTSAAASTGTLGSPGSVSGTAAAASTATATLTGAGALAGTAAAASTGTLGSPGSVSGTAAAAGTATAALAGVGALIGTAAAAAAATAALTGRGALIAAAAAVSGATGTIINGAGLAGTAPAVATATGTLAGAGALTGASVAASAAAGTLIGFGPIADGPTPPRPVSQRTIRGAGKRRLTAGPSVNRIERGS